VNHAPWRVELTRTALRDLRRLDPSGPPSASTGRCASSQPILTAPASCARLSGAAEWRLRIGDWRALVLLDQRQRVVQVTRVLPRGRAYRD
jgi:mRNA-degrading endonuclease RelE of RelBE toxin-antitoxin system